MYKELLTEPILEIVVQVDATCQCGFTGSEVSEPYKYSPRGSSLFFDSAKEYAIKQAEIDPILKLIIQHRQFNITGNPSFSCGKKHSHLVMITSVIKG